MVLDVSDTGLPVQLAEAKPFEGYHEDISMDGERILVGAHDEGAVFFDLELTQLATLPVDDAFAVGLVGDRAVVTHNTTLELWDVSDLDDAQLLDTVEMGGEGRDIAFDGAHLAVGLGGNGVGVYAVESDDTLVHRGDLEVPGSAFGVSLDGDYLWASAWEETVLAWVGGGEPLPLGAPFETVLLTDVLYCKNSEAAGGDCSAEPLLAAVAAVCADTCDVLLAFERRSATNRLQ